jgi:exosortase
MASAPVAAPATTLRFDRPAQIRAAIVAAAFVGVYYSVLLDLQFRWRSADWSHGWLIPFFSIYLVYRRWDRVKRAPVRYTWVGLLLMLAALGIYQYSLWGLIIGYLRPFSMLVCLLGVIIFLCGLPIVRHIWVPWLYLFFAVPIPKGYYFALTDPLRRMAATVATHVLNLFPNLEIERVGSTIHYVYMGQSGTLGVADACSGMRSTMTLCALGVAVTFVSDRPWWQRLIMIASCIPIAVFSNFVRVTTTCVLHVFVDPKYAGGTYHTILGLGTLLLAFGVFAGLGWLLNNLFVEEPAAEAAENRGT